MKTKMKKAGWVVLLLLFVACLGSAKTVKAAEVNAAKVAYVNPSTKRLVLKFQAFSAKGYTYTVTNLNTKAKVKSGSLKYTKGQSKLLVSLGKKYKGSTRYKLVVTSKDKAKTLTTYFYTGHVMSNGHASITSKEAYKVSWDVANSGVYHGYTLKLCKGADSPFVSVATLSGSGGTESLSIPSTSLVPANYTYYVIGYLSIGGITYYGQGITDTYGYVKHPGPCSGLTASRNEDLVTLDWNGSSSATSYTVLKSSSANGTYTEFRSGIKDSKVTLYGLKNNKTYYFKVMAVASMGSTYLTGTPTNSVKVTIPLLAGTAGNPTFRLDNAGRLYLEWSAGDNVSGYTLYYQNVTTGSAYKPLDSTKSEQMYLDSLNAAHTYRLKIRSYRNVNGSKSYSNIYSPEVVIQPRSYLAANKARLMAMNVRSIGYNGDHCDYTTGKYSTAVKTAFVNYKGYTSKTKYLIWISHYTQQCSIFTGSKGKWKQIRTFTVATGKAQTHSPRGIYKTTYKEKGWFYVNTKELYVTHWAGRNSFHTRPLYNDGSVCDPTIGRPASHGCCRCYNKDARYIYKNIPKGTTVISY